MIPTGVFHDPVAQANYGLYPSSGVLPKFSILGPFSYGLLWGGQWVGCDSVTTASWDSCGFTAVASWDTCGFTNSASWGDC